MTTRKILTVFGLITLLGCRIERRPIITIVNIEQSNRITLGQQLRIIKKYSPKIIALDFYLVPDSLGRDSILVKELATAKNTVQVVGLHNKREVKRSGFIWDSLEVSHSKFKVADQGFANLASEDSVLAKELPMVQNFLGTDRRMTPIYSFSYVVAQNSFGVRTKFKKEKWRTFGFNLDQLGKNYKLITKDQLFSGDFKKEDLADKIMIMGYMGDKEDFLYTDSSKRRKINGVEVHAAIIDEIIDD